MNNPFKRSKKPEGNENPELCRECGGACCKNHPGLVSPYDLGNSLEEIERNIFNRLENGKFTMDYWEGLFQCEEYPEGVYPAFFMRPKVITEEGVEENTLNAGWGGVCVFLREDGCPFSYRNRPKGCRSLVPSPDKICNESVYTKEEACREWMAFREVTLEALGMIKNK